MKAFLHLWEYLAKLFSEWEIFPTKFVEKNKTYILCSLNFSENRTVYEVNEEIWCTAREATDDNTVWRTRIACWIPKTTDAHSEYVIHIAFTWQQCLLERASMLGYTCIVCLVRTEMCLLCGTKCIFKENPEVWFWGVPSPLCV